MADVKKEKVEIAKNCPSCKKVMKRKNRYYREGAYYCNNNCYKQRPNAVKEAAPAAEAAAS